MGEEVLLQSHPRLCTGREQEHPQPRSLPPHHSQKPSSLTLAVPAGRPSSLASLLGRKNENSRNMDIESTVGKEEGLGGGKGGGPIERTGIVAEGMGTSGSGGVVQNTGRVETDCRR